VSGSLAFQLHELIHSLTRGEKRHFQLYARRNTQKRESKFLQLFQLLDKMSVFSEEEVDLFLNRDVKNKSKLKSHLYEAIMTSLELLKKDELELRIRELISHAQLLYHKSLYGQASTQLSKAKKIAESNEQFLHMLEILKYEKLIEAKTIKSSHYQQALQLSESSKRILKKVEEEFFWSDLSLKLYNHYLKVGHVRNEQELRSMKVYFRTYMKGRDEHASTFEGELNRIQCHVWYAYIIQDFQAYYYYGQEWSLLYEKKQKWRCEDYDSYMMGMHNSLVALFYQRDVESFEGLRIKLLLFVEQHQSAFLENTKLNAFWYTTISLLNLYIVKGEYHVAYAELKDIDNQMESLNDGIDIHRKLMLYYKMGNVCFGASRFKEAIHYFNLIDQSKTKYIRNDIYCFSRIFSLIAHFEVHNDFLIEYQVKSTYRYLVKMENMDKVQEEVLQFLKSSLSFPRAELLPEFKRLQKRLLVLCNDRYSRRPLLYMDLLAWLRSHIEKRKIEDIVKEEISGRN
jgi:hypothetical protein